MGPTPLQPMPVMSAAPVQSVPAPSNRSVSSYLGFLRTSTIKEIGTATLALAQSFYVPRLLGLLKLSENPKKISAFQHCFLQVFEIKKICGANT